MSQPDYTRGLSYSSKQDTIKVAVTNATPSLSAVQEIDSSVSAAISADTVPDVASLRYDAATKTFKIGENVFDAVVDANNSGPGLYSNVRLAIVAGKRTIYVRPGIYTEENYTLYDASVTIIGESAEKCVLDFNGIAGRLEFRPLNLYYYNTGTITLANGSTAVSVSGGSMPAVGIPVKVWLRVNNTLLEVASIDDATNLTLAETYRGAAISGEAYELLGLIDEVRVENITLRNSTTTMLQVYQARRLLLDNVILSQTNSRALYSLDCDFVSLRRVRVTNCINGFTSAAMCAYGRMLCVQDSEFNNNDMGRGGFDCNFTQNVFIDRCNFSSNDSDGLVLRDVQQAVVRGCTMHNNGRWNLHILNTSTPSAEVLLAHCESVGGMTNLMQYGSYHITECLFTDATTAAAAPITDAGNVVVSGCYFANNVGDGLELLNCGDITVTECIMDTNGDRGIEISSCSSACVSNCQLDDNVAFGIVIDNTPRCIINGNRLNSATGNNIFLTTNCSESVVSNNQCNIGTISVLTSDNSVVANNSLFNATLNGITCSGAHMLISGNLVQTTATNGIDSSGDNCYVHGNKTIGCAVNATGTGTTAVANA